MHIRPLAATDRQDWLEDFVIDRWSAPTVVGHGQVYRVAELPGFVALENNAPLGVITFTIEDDACEVVTIDSLREGGGIGTALLRAVLDEAREAGCKRVWLITTNDNLPMLRFAQKRGFMLVAVHPNALEKSRALKPEIPLLGIDRIPIRDELELERAL